MSLQEICPEHLSKRAEKGIVSAQTIPFSAHDYVTIFYIQFLIGAPKASPVTSIIKLFSD